MLDEAMEYLENRQVSLNMELWTSVQLHQSSASDTNELPVAPVEQDLFFTSHHCR